jgi:hypothetical protein
MHIMGDLTDKRIPAYLAVRNPFFLLSACLTIFTETFIQASWPIFAHNFLPSQPFGKIEIRWRISSYCASGLPKIYKIVKGMKILLYVMYKSNKEIFAKAR